MESSGDSAATFTFGPFVLDTAERRLSRDGEPVPLRAKLFDTLCLLVQRPGRLIERQELIDTVWPDSIVEEGNLSHNVSALRRALGDGNETKYIETVPKRGYRFVHAVTRVGAAPPSDVDLLPRARRAVARGAHREGFQLFEAAERTVDLSIADRICFAEAARWSGNHDRLVPLLESAAEASRENGDANSAARCALDLAFLMLERGRPALARSYLRQAERSLALSPDGESMAARRLRLLGRLEWLEGRWEAALANTEASVAAARTHGDRDSEALALIESAMSMIALRRFDDAIPKIVESGAVLTGGDLSPPALGLTLCGLITVWRACGRLDRATEWLDASLRWVDSEEISSFPGICRVHRGELNGLRGGLAEAEADLLRGIDELSAAGSVLAGMGLRELGHVRLRRGDLDGAEQAFHRAMEFGFDPQPGLAQLRATRGEAELACRDLERFLADAPEGPHSVLDRENRFMAVAALVPIAVAVGASERAQLALDELDAIATATGSPLHRAAVAAAAGEVALATGRTDEAILQLQRGWRGFAELASPYEAAATRARLGDALLRDGDVTRARMELEGAAATFERIGAELELRGVAQKLRDLATSGPARQRVVAYGEIADESRLRELTGEAGWADLTGWLTRRLATCWQEHGGRELPSSDTGYAVAFADRASCLACVDHVQRSLREHRARHGFAPSLRVGIACETAGSKPAVAEQNLVDLARQLAQLCSGGEFAITGERPTGATRTVAVPGQDLVAHVTAAGDAGAADRSAAE